MRHRLGSLAIAALVLSASCGDRVPSGPTAVPTPSPAPPVDPQPSGIWSLSGTMFIHGVQGRVVAPEGTPFFGWIETGTSGFTTRRLNVAAAGAYRITAVAGATTRIRVTRGATGYMPCAVTRDMTGNAEADVHLVTDPRQLGGHLPAELASQGPTLSGAVYEETANGRVPVPNAWVSLDGLYGLGLMIADTLTDAEGRYLLCGVPQLPGLTLYVSATGFPLAEIYDGLVGRAALDVVLKR